MSGWDWRFCAAPGSTSTQSGRARWWQRDCCRWRSERRAHARHRCTTGSEEHFDLDDAISDSGERPVPEFKIEGDALRREARFRMLSWGSVLLLLAVTLLLFTLRASGRLNANSDLRFVFAFTLLGTIIGACVLASREALHFAEREMIFVLNDNEIVQKRKGYPDVKIAFSEIATLREELRWLIIKTAEPQRKIAI